MIRFIIFIIFCCLIAVLCSCNDNRHSGPSEHYTQIIDGCKYAILRTTKCCAMVHAGNCKNEIHIQSDRIVLANGWEIYLKRESWDSEKIKAFKDAFETIYGTKKLK